MRTLAECESVIANGIESFAEVGAALLEINDHALYKTPSRRQPDRTGGYGSFEEYLAECWPTIARSTAYQLMTAYGVTTKLSAMADTSVLPKTERVARELAPLRNEPEVMSAIWRDVLAATPEGRAPSALAVRRAVMERREPCLTPKLTTLLRRVTSIVAAYAEVGPILDRISADDLMDLSYTDLDELGQIAKNVHLGLQKLSRLAR